jgi:hypothetical protein
MRLKGSIVEPVIAIVILVFSMAMAFTILMRTNHAPKIQAQNRASELINTARFNTVIHSDFLDASESSGAFTLVKKVTEFEEGKCVRVDLQVYDAKQELVAKEDFILSVKPEMTNE